MKISWLKLMRPSTRAFENWTSLLCCVSLVHALAGSLIISSALLLGLWWLRAQLPGAWVELGTLGLGPLSGLLSAARLRLPPGDWRRQLALEARAAAALSLVLAGGAFLIVLSLGLLPAAEGTRIILSFAAAGPAYLVFRAAVRAWLR